MKITSHYKRVYISIKNALPPVLFPCREMEYSHSSAKSAIPAEGHFSLPFSYSSRCAAVPGHPDLSVLGKRTVTQVPSPSRLS